MKTHKNVIDFGSPTTYSSVSKSEWENLLKRSTKKWHFEKGKKGYIPVSDELETNQ